MRRLSFVIFVVALAYAASVEARSYQPPLIVVDTQIPTPTATPSTPPTQTATPVETVPFCLGDDNGDGVVTVDEVVRVVRNLLDGCPTFCPGDCDGDGVVDDRELEVVLEIKGFQQPLSKCPAADSDGDGYVDTQDYIRAAGAWANGCP